MEDYLYVWQPLEDDHSVSSAVEYIINLSTGLPILHYGSDYESISPDDQQLPKTSFNRFQEFYCTEYCRNKCSSFLSIINHLLQTCFPILVLSWTFTFKTSWGYYNATFGNQQSAISYPPLSNCPWPSKIIKNITFLQWKRAKGCSQYWDWPFYRFLSLKN